MDERRADHRDERDDEPAEGRAQHVEPDVAGDGGVEPPPDPDRPTDEVRRGNTLAEPAPGD
jgi:hypothetical protein